MESEQKGGLKTSLMSSKSYRSARGETEEPERNHPEWQLGKRALPEEGEKTVAAGTGVK